MKIIYKCKCSAERSIDVTDRVPDTDIAAWMEQVVQPAISYDHAMRNALCRSGTMEYCKIPMDGDAIGVPPTKN